MLCFLFLKSQKIEIDDMDVFATLENNEIAIGSGEKLKNAFETRLNFQFTIPETAFFDDEEYKITKIGEYSFFETSVTKIFIPKTIKTIQSTCFEKCYSLKSIEVSPENPYFLAADNILTDKAQTILIHFSHDADQCSIPKTVSILSDSCFSATKMRTFQFLPRYKSIGKAIFSGCKKLKKVTMKKGTITSIPERMFMDCNKLSEIELPNKIDFVGDFSFANTKLKNIQVDDCISYIGCSAFMNTDIKRIDLFSKNVSVLHKNVFVGCTKLERIQLPDVLESIEEGAFLNCRGLMTVIYRGYKHFEDKNVFVSSYPKVFVYKLRYTWYQFCGIDVHPYDPKQDINTLHKSQTLGKSSFSYL